MAKENRKKKSTSNRARASGSSDLRVPLNLTEQRSHSQQSEAEVAISKTFTREERADRWLKSQADQSKWEAIVYVVSRYGDLRNFAASLLIDWKRSEEIVFDEYLRGKDFLLSKLETDFESISFENLPDFWTLAQDQKKLSHEWTVYRAAEICNIGGFDRWFRRHAKQLQESIRLTPQLGLGDADHLFNYCRSNLAIRSLHIPLKDGINARILEANRSDAPVRFGDPHFDYASPPSPVQNLTMASALLFCAHRLGVDQEQDYKAICDYAADLLIRAQHSDGNWPEFLNLGDFGLSSPIFTTCLAIHALTIAKPHGYEPAVMKASDWLWSVQNLNGSWGMSCHDDFVELTVLALDAIDLANGKRKVTFDIDAPTQILSKKNHVKPRKKLGRPMKSDPATDAKIAAAFQKYRTTHPRASYQDFAETFPMLITGQQLTRQTVKAAMGRNRQRNRTS